MTAKESLTYKDLQTELQRVLMALESDGTSIDEVGELLKQGFETVDLLKARLTAAEAQIDNIIALRHQSLSANTSKETDGHDD